MSRHFIMLLRKVCSFHLNELPASGIAHLMFSDCSRPHLTEAVESEAVDRGHSCLSERGRGLGVCSVCISLYPVCRDGRFAVFFPLSGFSYSQCTLEFCEE